jgi:DNA-binding NtrC family response regulator
VIAVVGSSEAAVRSLSAGALYALRTPVSAEEVALLLSRTLGEKTYSSMAVTSRRSLESNPTIVGETVCMRNIKDRIRSLARTSITGLLLQGESGTGKDTIARAVHGAASPAAPFVYVNFAERSPEMLELELFGAAPGLSMPSRRPGLLDRADGGTLYLDEIALIPSGLQMKLLRFLKDVCYRPVGATKDLTSNVRILSATSHDLRVGVRNRKLNAELVRRLSLSVIDLPPLRDRLPDIPLLVRHFLEQLSSRLNRPLSGVTDSTLQLLVGHRWPGNLRELANALEREAVRSEGPVLAIQSLPEYWGQTSRVNYRLPAKGIVFRDFEREVLLQALDHAKGNQTRAAALLKLSRDQLRYRMAKFGVRLRNNTEPSVGAAPRDATLDVIDDQ